MVVRANFFDKLRMAFFCFYFCHAGIMPCIWIQ
jgi:hypothetical protein